MFFHKLGLIFCLVYSFSPALAQPKWNKEEALTISGRMIEQGRWSDLIRYHRHCRHHDLRFTDLDQRAGLAAFMMNDFRKASILWGKTKFEELPDSIGKLDLIASGSGGRALHAGRRRVEALKTSGKGLWKRIVSPVEIFAEAGNSLNLSVREPLFPFSTSLDSSTSMEYRRSESRYAAAGLSFLAAGRFLLHSSLSSQDIRLNLGVSDWMGNQNRFPEQIRIDQLALGISFPIVPVLSCQIAGNFGKMTVKRMNYSLDSTFQSVFDSTSQTDRESVFFSSLVFEQPRFQVSATFAYSDFVTGTWMQPGLELMIFPFGNLNFYCISRYWHLIPGRQASQPENPSSRSIAGQTIGFRITRWCWIETQYYLGTLSEFVENGGFVIYNNKESISDRTDLNLIFPLFKNRFQLNLRARAQSNSTNVFHLHKDGMVEKKVEPFQEISAIIGFKGFF